MTPEARKLKLFHVHHSPWAYVAFAVELGCIAVAARYSWVAAVAVFVAIATQACWQVYMEEKLK